MTLPLFPIIKAHYMVMIHAANKRFTFILLSHNIITITVDSSIITHAHVHTWLEVVSIASVNILTGSGWVVLCTHWS